MYITQKAITKNGKKKAQGRLSYPRTISPEPIFKGFCNMNLRIFIYFMEINLRIFNIIRIFALRKYLTPFV